MTDLSVSRLIKVTCPGCMIETEVEFYEVIDIEARPDLAERLRTGSFFLNTCPNFHLHDIDQSIMVIWQKMESPVIYVSSDKGSSDQDQKDFMRLFAQISQDKLLNDSNDYALRITQLSKGLLPIALAQDFKIRQLMPALGLILSSESLEDMQNIITEFPELLSTSAQQALSHLIDAASWCPTTKENKDYLFHFSNVLAQFTINTSKQSQVIQHHIISEDTQNALMAWQHFNETQNLNDLHNVIASLERALEQEHPNHVKTNLFHILSISLALKAQKSETAYHDLKEAICIGHQAFNLTPDGYPNKRLFLIILRDHLYQLYELTESISDLKEVISVAEHLCNLTSDGHADRPKFLFALGVLHGELYKATNEPSYLEKAISISRKAVNLAPDGYLDKAKFLNFLGLHLADLYTSNGIRNYIDEAISVTAHAINLTPDFDENKPEYLNSMSRHLSALHSKIGDRSRQDEAIHMIRQAIDLAENNHPGKPMYLNNLSSLLGDLYASTGDLSYLRESIDLSLLAVELTSDSNEQKPMFLNNLGMSFGDMFVRLQEQRHLDEAINCIRKAVNLTPDSHEHKPMYLRNLGKHLGDLYKETQEKSHLNQAINCVRHAVELTPDTHINKPLYFSSLGTLMHTLFKVTKEETHLDGAICFIQEALELISEAHHNKPIYLNKLASYLNDLFILTRKKDHFNQAYDLWGQAIKTLQHKIIENEDYRGIAAGAAEYTRTLLKEVWRATDTERLVDVIELGKGIKLRSDIIRSGRNPEGLDEDSERDYENILKRISEINTELDVLSRSSEIDLSILAEKRASLHREQLDLRKKHQDLERGDSAFDDATLTYSEVRELAQQTDQAIVYLQPFDDVPDGLLVVLIHRDSPKEQPAPEDILSLKGWHREGVHEAIYAQGHEIFFEKKTLDFSKHLGWYVAYYLRNLGGGYGALLKDTLSRLLTKLGQDIMESIAKRLKELKTKRILLIPGDKLGMLPLHAAPIGDEKTPFCEIFETCYAPSVTALSHCLNRPRTLSPHKLVGIANPDSSLPFAEIEMRRVEDLYMGRASITYGADATKKWLLQEAQKGDILALSTHASFNPMNPRNAEFILAHPKGKPAPEKSQAEYYEKCEKLALDDIWRRELELKPGAIVIADACETGHTDMQSEGEEYVGFPAAFLGSGASCVIASLWAVDDFSTALLMEIFYQEMEKGTSPGQAMQTASKTLRLMNKGQVNERLQSEIEKIEHALNGIKNGTDEQSLKEAEKLQGQLNYLIKVQSNIKDAEPRPFAHPYYWGAFGIHGVM